MRGWKSLKLFRNMTSFVPKQYYNNSRSVEVQGHRGNRGHLPENSLPAFLSAVEAGADALELDLHLTSDMQIVVYHDYTISNRVCVHADGSEISDPILLRGMTLAQLQEFDIGQKKSPKHPDQMSVSGLHIPTLKQLFEAVQAHPKGGKIRFNLEIKRDETAPDSDRYGADVMADAVIQEVVKLGMQDRVAYSSFDFDILRHVRKLAPNATIGVLQEHTLDGLADKVLEINAQIVSPSWDLLKTQEDVDKLRKCIKAVSSVTAVVAAAAAAGVLTVDSSSSSSERKDEEGQHSDGVANSSKTTSQSSSSSSSSSTDAVSPQAPCHTRIVVYTPNTEEQWKSLIAFKVDGIITDYPQALIQFMDNVINSSSDSSSSSTDNPVNGNFDAAASAAHASATTTVTTGETSISTITVDENDANTLMIKCRSIDDLASINLEGLVSPSQPVDVETFTLQCRSRGVTNASVEDVASTGTGMGVEPASFSVSTKGENEAENSNSNSNSTYTLQCRSRGNTSADNLASMGGELLSSPTIDSDANTFTIQCRTRQSLGDLASMMGKNDSTSDSANGTAAAAAAAPAAPQLTPSVLVEAVIMLDNILDEGAAAAFV